MVDLLLDDATTTKKGVVKLATDTETTAGLAVQASDPRLLNDNSVTFSKIQDLTDKRLIGRAAGTNGDPHEIIIFGNDLSFDLSLGQISVNDYDRFLNKVELFEDCMGGVQDGTSGTGLLAQVSSGTGSTIDSVQVTETGIFGVFNLKTGTTSTGFATLYGGGEGAFGAFLLGQGVTKIKTKIQIPDLSTSGERYKLLFGFVGASDSATVNDGVYFEYAEGTSNNWRTCTSNDATRTQNTSTTAVAADTWVRLEIIINAAGTSVDFLLNGSIIDTITTNIPSGTGDPVSPILGIYKSAGTTDRTLWTDYMGMSIKLTTPRT